MSDIECLLGVIAFILIVFWLVWAAKHGGDGSGESRQRGP